MFHLPTAHRMDLIAPLPTWIPDFSRGREGQYVRFNDKESRAGSFAKPRILVADMELTLGAIELDTIEDVLGNLVGWPVTPGYLRCSSSMKQDIRRYVDYDWETKFYFRTKQGNYGFSSKVRAGDEVIIPLGAKSPVVIRLDDGRRTKQLTTEHYELVDECYVDGFMKGEVEKMKEAGRAKVKDYKIR